MTEDRFEKMLSLQVSVQIIKHISSGLYRSPASALKELLSNSYDADAKNVVVEFHFLYGEEFKPLLQKITVKDDGNGMDLDNLVYAFTHIGGSLKELEEEKKTKELKRDMIGRLGIGMLSIASACRSFTVKTKKKGEDNEYRAEISLSFFDDIRELKESMDKFSIGNVKITSTKGQPDQSYTIVEITDFKPPFLSNILDNISDSYFYYNNVKGTSQDELNAYFINFIERMCEAQKLAKLPIFDQIIAYLALMSPVEYLPDGPVRPTIVDKNGEIRQIPGATDEVLQAIKKKLKDANFNVFCKIIKEKKGESSPLKVNEFKLFKPLRYPLDSDLKKFPLDELDPYVFSFTNYPGFELENEAGKKIRATIRGYAYHQYARILPHEFRGILFRVFNVAIGENFRDELRLYSEDPVVLHQLEVEVFLDGGFDSIVNLDRESLFEGSRTHIYLRHYLDNLFKGKAPERPAVTTQVSGESSENLTQENVAEVTERPKETTMTPEDEKFYARLISTLPEKQGLIEKIKSKREMERKKKLEKKNPMIIVQNTILSKYNADIVKPVYSTNEDEFGKITNEERELRITIPKIKGSRSKVWDSIFITAAAMGPVDDKFRKDLMKTLYEIYKLSENKKD